LFQYLKVFEIVDENIWYPEAGGKVQVQRQPAGPLTRRVKCDYSDQSGTYFSFLPKSYTKEGGMENYDKTYQLIPIMTVSCPHTLKEFDRSAGSNVKLIVIYQTDASIIYNVKKWFFNRL
jgi:hypothetical protein